MKVPWISKITKPAPSLIGLSLAGLIGAGGFTYYFLGHKQLRRNSKALTVPVQIQDLSVRITASGTVVPVQEVNLSPKAAGQLAKLYVDQGDRVGQGQILAQMDDKDIQAQLRQQKANLALAQARLAEARAGSRIEEIGQAQAQVNAAKVQANLTHTRSLRNQKLFRQGAISRDQLDEALTNERNAQANIEQAQQRLKQLRKGTRPEQIDQAQAQVAQAEAQLQAVQVQEENTKIRAPFSGIITQKYANVGAFVTPTTSASATSSATSTSIVAIAGKLEVLAKVPETDITQIKPGQQVKIVADALPSQTFQGKVRLVAPAAVVEQNVTSFQVRVALLTGQAQLRSGMNVDLTFLGDRLKNALVIPTVAIVTEKGQTGVLVPDARHEPQFHSVTIGFSMGNQTQVIQGLQPGERVFVYFPKVPQPQKSNNGPPVRFR